MGRLMSYSFIVRLKGGAGSGHRGHGGRPGQIGGSSPRVSISNWKKSKLVKLSSDGEIPKYLLQETALIMVHDDGSMEAAIGAGMGGIGSVHHADMAHKLGMSASEYDSSMRPVYNGRNFIITSTSVGTGGKSFRSGASLDKFASKRISKMSKALIKAGYSSDTILTWFPSVGSSVKLKLGDW